MPLRIGIENGTEERTIIWAFDFPGCTSYGEDFQAALSALPEAVLAYNHWLGLHGLENGAIPVGQAIELEETWDVYHIDEKYALTSQGYEVNAWFLNDWKRLSEEEMNFGIQLLAASREELLTSFAGLNQETLHKEMIGERWSIAGILNHVAQAEWWYLDRLGAASPVEEFSMDPQGRLSEVRAQLISILPDLAASNAVVGIDGEFWSPRKLLRRAVWHERDHTAHILKLLAD